MSDVSASWHGLHVSGTAAYDPGVHTFSNGDPGYPPSGELEIDSLEIDDAEEFSAWVDEYEHPSHWKTLSREAKREILSMHGRELEEALWESFS